MKQSHFCLYFLFIVSACATGTGERNADFTANRLKDANSPYLRQHANNPVDWYEWGPEALQKAKAENKPLIISIGYASCHWCHVMARESFMDTAIARIMNENFVSIKIDREERPDIDQIYMNAAQLITGSGGWPLNAFALPDGRPFHAGTYYPPGQWMSLLRQMSDIFKNENAKLVEYADALTQGIQAQEVIHIPADTTINFNIKAYNAILESWQSQLDHEFGGFSGEPKFPFPVAGTALLQHSYLTGNNRSLQLLTTTLDAMAKGGIYDQLGGGFSRYSIDKYWKVPHFEKMLYDNGQLVSLYAQAFKMTKNPLYAEIVDHTLAFVGSELTSPEGGFYASLNAESDGEEGKYYVWTEQEVAKTLDKETFTLVAEYFGIAPEGNWEDAKNVFFIAVSEADFVKKHGLSMSDWKKTLNEAKTKLLKVREQRTRPSTDEKILSSWNALMMMGYLDAYTAIGNTTYLDAALRNATFIEKKLMTGEGKLFRSYNNGKAGIDAFLDDYALVARAYIQLYQATFDVRWLQAARSLADYAIAHFHESKSGMFYYTSDLSGELVARKMELSDNAIPASNSVMADVLYLLGEYFYEPKYVGMSKNMITQMADKMPDGGPYYANWARLFGLLTFQPYEVVIMGDDALAGNQILQSHYLPLNIYSGGTEENLPLLEYKLVKGQTIYYICRNKTCKAPLKDAQQAVKQLSGIQGKFPTNLN